MKGKLFSAVNTVAVVELLHAQPALHGCFPIADAVDMTVRWNA